MQIPKKAIRCHKRHFQLLELMIAAFILLICIAPVMRTYISIYQSQQGIIRENQRDHLAHMMHAKFTEQLYKRTISLEEIMQNKSLDIKDPDLNKLLKESAYECTGSFTLTKPYTPRGQEKPTKYLGVLEIKMRDTLYKRVEKEEFQKIENQDPANTFYDYYVYVDAGEMDKKQNNRADNEKAQPSRLPEKPNADLKNPPISQSSSSPSSEESSSEETEEE